MALVTEKELCELLKVNNVFLWKCRKRGLPFYRLGSKIIRYNVEEVLKWFDEQGMMSA